MSGAVSLAGKVVWITGAGSGIGRALAVEFARHGVRLVLSGRRAGALDETAGLLGLDDRQVWRLPLDVTDHGAVATASEAIGRHWGGVDVLVGSAGCGSRGRVEETAMAVDQAVMAVNYFGTVAAVKAVLPQMLARRQGWIVAISSVSGKVGTPERAPYVASKHALQGFCDALRAEVTDRGVKVLVVCPGYVRTDFPLGAITAGGGRHGRLDRNQERGVAPEKVARKVLAGLLAGRREVYVGGWEVAAIYLARWWPGLLARLLARRAGKRGDGSAGKEA
ncbi:MAG: SDR family oxidoreductase [Negativicutes bacterium]|nr:SDR family oxidoreductase [Negativicutes bacterium]